MADESRIDAWMALAERVKAVFPGLETAEAMEAHRRAALDFMRRASAICALDGERDVVVITYREGAPEGAAARAFYARLGVVPGRLTEEFGSPVQEFVMKRQGGELQGQSL